MRAIYYPRKIQTARSVSGFPQPGGPVLGRSPPSSLRRILDKMVESRDMQAEATDSYAVALTRSDIDRFGHNALFSAEIAAAFAAVGLTLRVIDYIRETRIVFAALQDPACAF